MSLEHYKTQVLLLHSQQSTLDTLSAGFSDRYSVHCATSGTEALNTLGDTPIHVFVSAQDLPGMSGLDAIREAKKRSPDTIGILLAGTDKQDGLEALVSDHEVFQIVRGTIEPANLLELIESATKSVRLITLAESANDHKANVDEPVFDESMGEHIVMETSENGSAIISDGTGTLPVLRPTRITLAPGVGGREVDVLVLTKDDEFLATIKDSARGLHNVYHAVTPAQAEGIVVDHKVGVLVTDAAMVGSNIEGLTQRLRAKRARIVAIVAGRRDDGELLMDLINRGHVYRFLLKPVSPGRARLAIEASVKHHMEAPEDAFKPKSQPAPVAAKPKPAPPPANPKPLAQKPAPAPVAAKAAPKPVPKAAPAPAPAPKPVPKPPAPKAATTPKAAPRAAPEPPPVAKPAAVIKPAAAEKPVLPAKPPPARKAEPTMSAARIEPTIDDSLDSAFDDSSGFAETMTDIASSLGKSITGARESVTGGTRGMLGTVGDISVPSSNKKYFAIGGAVAVVAIGAWFLLGGDGAPGDVPREAITTAAPTPSTAPAPEPVVEAPVQQTVSAPPAAIMMPEPESEPEPLYAALLDEARAARDAGNLITPAGNSAVELYVAVMTDAGNDPVVMEEMDAVVSQVLGLAETAILARNVANANAALAMAQLADPANPRLTFLGAQLTDLQLNDTAAQARLAIREQRFEDADNLIADARALGSKNTTEVGLLTDELAAARVQQQVGETIATANRRLESGALIAPASDNARYYFQQALTSDPQNQAAQQGLITVANKLVLQAREAIDGGDFGSAEALLGDARSLDPGSIELSAASNALTDAREAIAEAERQAEAERLAEIQRQQEAARQAEAERLAELARQQAERDAALERERQAARLAELDRQAEAERRAEAERQAALRRDAEARQREADRIAAEKRNVQTSELARIEAEKQANQTATVSPLGVGAPAPANNRPAATTIDRSPRATSQAAAPVAQAPTPRVESAQAALPAGGGATTFRLPGNSGSDSAAQRQQSQQSLNRQVATQTPPPVTSRPTTDTATRNRNSTPSEPELVPVSQLTRTNYVGPEYPRGARRRNVTGTVEVMFTVTTDGRVRSMSILRSDPEDTFDQAAMDAVEQWRFEPVIENGAAVEKRTAVRLAFDLK